jgi:hypothetical protein
METTHFDRIATMFSPTTSRRLGCAWRNNGTITARTDPSLVSGEAAALATDNTLLQTFGAAIRS